MRSLTRRRARLRREYASLYPAVTPGAWIGADRMVRAVRSSSRDARVREGLGQRVLSETHFEFRGGVRRRSVQTRTRASDRSPHPLPSLRHRLMRILRRFVTRHLLMDDPYERAKDSEAARQRQKPQ